MTLLDYYRAANADEAFATYDFGDEVVKGDGGWERQGDIWRKAVFFENDDAPSVKRTFIVRFQHGSVDVEECYVE